MPFPNSNNMFGNSGYNNLPPISLDAKATSNQYGAQSQGGGGGLGGVANSGNMYTGGGNAGYGQNYGTNGGGNYNGGYSSSSLFSYGTIDGMPTTLLDIGLGGPYPGDPGYNYGNSMKSPIYGPLGGFDPYAGLGGYPQGPYGPPGGYPNGQGLNRTLFKPGSAWNPVVAGVVGGGVSLLSGGNGIGGALGGAAGSMLGKTDTSQAIWGGVIGGVTGFVTGGGLNMFKSADQFEGDDAEEQAENKKLYTQGVWGDVLSNAIGGLIGAPLG